MEPTEENTESQNEPIFVPAWREYELLPMETLVAHIDVSTESFEETENMTDDVKQEANYVGVPVIRDDSLSQSNELLYFDARKESLSVLQTQTISTLGIIPDPDAFLDEPSSSESDSSSDDSSSEDTASDSDSISVANVMMDDFDEDDDNVTGPPRTAHEMNQLPEDLKCPTGALLPDSERVEWLGYVSAVLPDEGVFVIQSTMMHAPLDVGSVIVDDERKVLGRVFETFGPVQQPLYSVRLPTQWKAESTPSAALEEVIVPVDPEAQKTLEKWQSFVDQLPPTSNVPVIDVSMRIFYVIDLSVRVLTQMLLQCKGCDASNLHDEEVPEEEREFSDDEQEKAAKTAQSQKRKRNRKQQQQRVTPQESRRVVVAEENYGVDDVDYVPMSRPLARTSMMPARPLAPQVIQQQPPLQNSFATQFQR